MSIRKNFNIELSINRRMEIDARIKNQNETQWINQAIAHVLACRETAPNQRLQPILTSIETTCMKCHKTIPPFIQIMYSSLLGGGLCSECYLQRFGDKGRLVNIMKQSELKEDIRVLTIELKEKTKEYAFVNHKAKLDDLLKKQIETEKLKNDILKNADEVSKLAESYFKEGFGNKELEELLEKWKKGLNSMKKETEKFIEQIEATQPLVRDLQDFDKQYFLERLKKRKSLKELSADYP